MQLVEIGEYIRRKRRILNLRQQDLSERCDVNIRTIHLIESGKGNPSAATLLKIFHILGIKLSLHPSPLFDQLGEV